MNTEPLSLSNWKAFETLFGERGACGGCWCMAYRMHRKEFVAGQQAKTHKQAMKKLVRAGKPIGLIGFINGQPAGWCALAPREDLVRFEKSRVHKRIDDLPVWSISCLFVDKKFRNRGVSLEMINAAIAYATRNNIQVIEAYPVNPAKGRLPDAFAWTGLLKTYLEAGFEVVDRTSKARPMVRWYSGH